MPNSPLVAPNLYIVGAQKAGSTTIAAALNELESVYVPPQKEMNFFSNPNWVSDIHGYLRHYPFRAKRRYWVDASPGYLWAGNHYLREDGSLAEGGPRLDVAQAIRSFSGPNTSIVISLRHPVRRAVSAFYHHFRMGRVATKDRIRTFGHRHGIVDLGFYSYHIGHYLKVFGPEQVRLVSFEKLAADHAQVIGSLFEWLELEETVPPATRSNEGIRLVKTATGLEVDGGIETIRTLRAGKRFAKMPDSDPPRVDPEDIAFLSDVYRLEIDTMKRLHPEIAEGWDQGLTLDSY